MRYTWMFAGILLVALAACSDTPEVVDETTSTTEPTTTTTLIVTTSTEATTTTVAGPGLTPDSNVTLRALGPVILGMNVSDAAEAAGLTLSGELDPEVADNCFYVTPDDSMKGVSFMVFENAIARIEIDDPSGVTTRSGAGIGTTRDELLEMYPDNIEETNEAVIEGQAMGFVPNDNADADYRIFFELDEDDVVVRFRVGSKPAVDFTEGCL